MNNLTHLTQRPRIRCHSFSTSRELALCALARLGAAWVAADVGRRGSAACRARHPRSVLPCRVTDGKSTPPPPLTVGGEGR